MPTLRSFFVAIILYALFVIYYMHVNAEPLKSIVRVKVTPPGKGAQKTTEQEILGVYDNNDGTVTIAISSCGSFLEVIVDKKALQTRDAMIVKVATEAMKNACK